MNYVEIDIQVTPKEPWADILTAELSEMGCDSFVSTENGLKAYAPSTSIEKNQIEQLPFLLAEMDRSVQLHYTLKEIKEQNWNAVWEADFEPVFVEEKLSILAPFHDKKYEKPLTVWVQPQMSFGTGHHQTTWMMAKMLMEAETIPDTVLDMGSGTGVLAILAEKLGGKNILAIDIEARATENCIENIARNNCSEIIAMQGDIDLIEGKTFGLILANINKNALMHQIPYYSKALKKNGTLFISGFFDSDQDDLIQYARPFNLNYIQHIHKENWACIQFLKM